MSSKFQARHYWAQAIQMRDEVACMLDAADFERLINIQCRDFRYDNSNFDGGRYRDACYGLITNARYDERHEYIREQIKERKQ